MVAWKMVQVCKLLCWQFLMGGVVGKYVELLGEWRNGAYDWIDCGVITTRSSQTQTIL